MRRPGCRLGRGIGRRAALSLALPATLGACGLFDGDFLGGDKDPEPGKRFAVMADRSGLVVTGTPRKVVLPTPAPNPDWPQVGGVPSHDMEHPALPPALTRSWSSGIGSGGGYTTKLTAQPLVAAGRVFTMDSNAVVAAFRVTDGSREWRRETRGEDDGNSNIGGGIAFDGGLIYAATGRGDVVAMQADSGKIVWRTNLGVAARAAPTVAEGKLFVPTLGNKLIALSSGDGKQAWAYQGTSAETMVFGLPSPAVADGLVIAGFGAGDIVCLRTASGTVAWADSLAAATGRNSLADLSTVRGRPVISRGRVFAIGLGGLMVALDQRGGRRLWERDVSSYETPWVAGDWIFILSQDSQVAALSANDGGVAWITQLDPFQNMAKHRDPIRWIGPVLGGDRLVVASNTGIALALSPYTGAILGRQPLGAPAEVAPSIAGGTLYMLTDDAALTAYR